MSFNHIGEWGASRLPGALKNGALLTVNLANNTGTGTLGFIDGYEEISRETSIKIESALARNKHTRCWYLADVVRTLDTALREIALTEIVASYCDLFYEGKTQQQVSSGDMRASIH